MTMQSAGLPPLPLPTVLPTQLSHRVPQAAAWISTQTLTKWKHSPSKLWGHFAIIRVFPCNSLKWKWESGFGVKQWLPLPLIRMSHLLISSYELSCIKSLVSVVALFISIHPSHLSKSPVKILQLYSLLTGKKGQLLLNVPRQRTTLVLLVRFYFMANTALVASCPVLRWWFSGVLAGVVRMLGAGHREVNQGQSSDPPALFRTSKA